MSLFKGNLFTKKPAGETVYPEQPQPYRAAETPSQPTVSEFEEPRPQVERTPKIELDAVSKKLLNAVEGIIESRNNLTQQVKERDRDLVERDNALNEAFRDIQFMKTKAEKLTVELSKAQEQVLDQKMQYEQLMNEFNSYKTQSEADMFSLHDDIEEREFKNRQLLLDLNKVRKDSAARIQDLESDVRDLKAKHDQLNEKYRRVLEDNKRLVESINNFASDASTLAQLPVYGSESS